MNIISTVILKKDLSLIFLKKQAILEILLFGLIIIFTFSLASSNLPAIPSTWTGTIFWVCSLFCSVLVFRELYTLEERERVFELLLVAGVSKESIWFSKTIAGLICLLFLQLFFLLITGIFLKTDVWHSFFSLFLIILLIDVGICVINSIFSGAMLGSSMKNSLLTTILFPLEIPLILGGIKVWDSLLSGVEFSQLTGWINLVVSFDVIFAGISLFLFPHVFGED